MLEPICVVIMEECIIEVTVVLVSMPVVIKGIVMIDLDILEVHVGHKEFVFIDDTIEWITERHIVNVTVTAADAAVISVIVGRVLLVFSNVWCDHEEELHWHTLNPATWQDQAIREAAVWFADVQWEIEFAIVGQHDVSVQFSVCGVILDGPVEFFRAALEGVHARG